MAGKRHGLPGARRGVRRGGAVEVRRGRGGQWEDRHLGHCSTGGDNWSRGGVGAQGGPNNRENNPSDIPVVGNRAQGHSHRRVLRQGHRLPVGGKAHSRWDSIHAEVGGRRPPSREVTCPGRWSIPGEVGHLHWTGQLVAPWRSLGRRSCTASTGRSRWRSHRLEKVIPGVEASVPAPAPWSAPCTLGSVVGGCRGHAGGGLAHRGQRDYAGAKTAATSQRTLSQSSGQTRTWGGAATATCRASSFRRHRDRPSHRVVENGSADGIHLHCRDSHVHTAG